MMANFPQFFLDITYKRRVFQISDLLPSTNPLHVDEPHWQSNGSAMEDSVEQ